MNKNNVKKVTSKLFILGLGFGLALGVNYVFAGGGNGNSDVYTPPTDTFPNGNTPAPINSGAASQTKAGGLTLAGAFIAKSGAEFQQTVTVGGDLTLTSGALLSQGISAAGAFIAKSGAEFQQTVTVSSLADSTTNQGNRPICVNSSGRIVICMGPTSVQRRQ
ncbi:MAG: hypothetical protein WCG08_05510 [Paludibacter sp.]